MSYVIKRRVTYCPKTVSFRFPALFTKDGILISHLKFLYLNRRKSQSWIERNSFAIYLLLQFITRQTNNFDTSTRILDGFVDALISGTIKDCYDESEMYWRPRSNKDVNTILGHVHSYCDYLDTNNGKGLPSLSPLIKATKAEERLLWCAYYKRTNNCFLNHLNSPEKQDFSYARRIKGPRISQVLDESVDRFPEESISRLCIDGFNVYSKKFDYCSILIVMLMHYGGLRMSECFQIYTSDVSIDTKTNGALLRVFDPSGGEAPEDGYNNRREYLQTKYSLQPRNEYERQHRLHAGWKDPLLTKGNLSFDVMFFPHSKSVEFIQILTQYLQHRVDGHHPFLFTNSSGDPESRNSFMQKHKRAVERIGLDYSKESGTSPHAHRHSYGYRLSANGFSKFEIQKAMHHKNPESCGVYTAPSGDDVRQKMRSKLEED